MFKTFFTALEALGVALRLVDQPSVQLVWRYVSQPHARQATSAMQREDLLIVVLVTALAGMVLGLVLFAKRNGKCPIKDVHDGRAWRSNCARSASDTALLIQHGERILSVRLQGHCILVWREACEQKLKPCCRNGRSHSG